MNNFLNLVYDDWEEGNEFPNANRPKQINNAVISTNTINCMWIPSYITLRVFDGLKIKNNKIDVITKYPNTKFYYHLWHRTPLIYDFFNNNLLPLDDYVIDLFKNNKNLNLIFMNETEVESKESLKKLNDLLIKNDMDVTRVYVVNNNQKLKVWKEELNTNINVHSSRILPQMFKNEKRPSFKMNKEDGSFFMCFNRSPRNHRYALLCLLKKYDLLTDTNWSLINGWQSDKIYKMNKYLEYFSQKDIIEMKNEIEYFETIEVFKSKYELGITNFDSRENQELFNLAESYENSYVNLVTETNFSDEAIHISEKSLKPFYYLQFPLILASYEHNKYVRDTYGFDLFEDMINYEYDSIRNNRDRLFTYVEEVKRIHKHKKFFTEFYENNKERFVKNHKIVANYLNTHDYNFFDKLSKI